MLSGTLLYSGSFNCTTGWHCTNGRQEDELVAFMCNICIILVKLLTHLHKPHSFCLLVPYLENTSLPEFADVFDPAGDPQKAMVGMMKVRDIPYAHINFTSAMRI